MSDKPKTSLPATMQAQADHTTVALPEQGLTLLDEASFDRAMKLAQMMSQAKGLPGFFGNSPGTCLAVIEDGLRLGISPFVVARNAYQATPSAPLAYYGKFVAAVINRSPLLSGDLEYEHTGDWSKIDGKFQIAEGSKTDGNGERKKYARASYSDRDEEGLGVIVRGTLRRTGEVKELELSIRQCYPRNSTLWATDPRQQICYVAARRWADRHAPQILMGIGTDAEADAMIDITPIGDQGPKAARPRAKTLDELVDARDKPAKASTEPKDERRASRAPDTPAGPTSAPSEPQAQNGDPSTYDGPDGGDLLGDAAPEPEAIVALRLPKTKKAKDLPLSEACDVLLGYARQCYGQAGADWITEAKDLNPWVKDHTATLETLSYLYGECMKPDETAPVEGEA